MDREELKRILAGYGMVGLMAAGGVALTAQPAMSAWAGTKTGAGSTPAAEQGVTALSGVKVVKSAEEIAAIVKELQPGQRVTISFAGKEVVLEAKK